MSEQDQLVCYVLADKIREEKVRIKAMGMKEPKGQAVPIAGPCTVSAPKAVDPHAPIHGTVSAPKAVENKKPGNIEAPEIKTA